MITVEGEPKCCTWAIRVARSPGTVERCGLLRRSAVPYESTGRLARVPDGAAAELGTWTAAKDSSSTSRCSRLGTGWTWLLVDDGARVDRMLRPMAPAMPNLLVALADQRGRQPGGLEQ